MEDQSHQAYGVNADQQGIVGQHAKTLTSPGTPGEYQALCDEYGIQQQERRIRYGQAHDDGTTYTHGPGCNL